VCNSDLYDRRVLSESVAGQSRQAGGKAFWWRLTDNVFRRLGWFLLPIVAMTMLGLFQASKTAQLFESTGTMSSSTNPLLPDPSIDGITSQFWESPAQATSRSLNERLGTENFMNSILQTAGLDDEFEAGLITLPLVRSRIWSTTKGDSIFDVHAVWDDPQTSYALAQATIEEFETFLENTASSTASAAEKYWNTRLERLEEQRAEAEANLTAFVDSLPPLEAGDELSPHDDLLLEQYRTAVSNVQEKISTAEERIDEAILLRTQRSSEASQSISIIDAPKVPTAPQSTVMKRIMVVMSFMMLGVVIALAALLVTTVLDHTVSSPADLLTIEGISLVATVPPVRFAGGSKGSGRGGRRQRRTERPAGVV
jgi:hypothetical protein